MSGARAPEPNRALRRMRLGGLGRNRTTDTGFSIYLKFNLIQCVR